MTVALDADRRAARERLREQDRRRRHARAADAVMNLAVFYGPRPLLLVPLGALDARGRLA
jgi:hypothetical protein